MGAGGVIVPPKTYFEKIMKVCERHEVFMISDEVITGFGRLGAAFGCDKLGFRPHSISIAKQMSSAYLPIAGVMIPEDMYQALLSESRKIGVFAHGFTYGGHPVSAAVALKAIEIYARDRVVEQVAAKAPKFQARLAALGQHPLVGEARGMGLIGRVVRFAEDEGLIVRAVMGDVLTLSPPLVISPAEIDELFDRLVRALDKTLDWAKRERLLDA
jgi:4-aminobutyrate--pyruvate transaminase